MPIALSDKEFDRILAAAIARFTVGFSHEPRDDEKMISAGSGTLVRYRGIGGVLTCAHVLRDALAHAEADGTEYLRIAINSVGAENLGTARVQLQEFKNFKMVMEGGTTESPSEQALGPDIGFVRLPASTMDALEAKGSALNLDRQEIAYRAGLPAGVTYEAALVSGVLKEGSEMVMVAGKRVTSFHNLIVSGQFTQELPSHGYDRVRFTPKDMAGFPGGQPKSFRGLSGGAAWLAGFKTEDDRLQLVERRLFGVVYFESEPDEFGKRSLLLHARGSIYKRMLPQIALIGTAE